MALARKTILVTGGCGFIGSHFVRFFLNRHKGWRVVNLDKLTYSGNPQNLDDVANNKRYVFVKGDIADQKAVAAVFKKYQPAYLVNFAAETHVDRSIHHGQDAFVHTNINGVYALLKAIKQHGTKRAVFVSTDEVYGSLPLKGRQKFSETTPLDPRSPYSASKAAGDLLCQSFAHTFGLPVIITRCSNNYGTHQYPEKLIPFFTLRAAAGQPLPLYGDGKNVRDWIHVLDHVRALDLILRKGKAGRIYNIGGDAERSNIYIARAILMAVRKPETMLSFIADRPGHDRRYAMSHARLTRELGWKPRYRFEKALPEIVRWYMDNKNWVAGIRKNDKSINPHIR